MEAVVLVGGFGTRLRPLTADTPKQMLPVVDRPMIEHVVAHLAAHGVTRVVLSLGFRPEAFTVAYPDGTCAGMPLHCAVEPEPLGTAGAVRFAALEAGIEKAFLVLNGDVLTDLDVTGMVARHRGAGALGTIALTEVDDPSRYGVVPFDDERRVLEFVEKPSIDEAPSRWINAGTYVLEPTVLDRIAPGHRMSIEREVFPTLAAEGALHAEPSDGYWLDTGTPEAYLRANLDLVDGTRADLTAVHEAAIVDVGARVHGSVVMAGSSIGSGTEVCDAVVMDGATIGHGSTVRASVVGPGATIGEGASVLGGCLVGPGATVASGTILDGGRFPEED